MKYAVLIGGCNGAGKTTFARQLLPSRYPDATFLNADEISRESPEYRRPIAAGRELIRRLERVVDLEETFVVETTLSSRMYLARIARWQRDGYSVVLHFIRLPSAQHAIRRVAERVSAGGHSVPERDIRRRFDRGLNLFHTAYSTVVDKWYLWNSTENGMSLEGESE